MIDGSPHLTWNFSDCSLALRFVFLTQQQRLNCVDVIISKRTSSSAADRTPVDCSELHQQPVDAVLRPTFVQKFCYKHCRYKLYIRTDFKSLSSLMNGVKVGAYAWFSVAIRVIFGVRFERRKKFKKGKPTWKLKHANSILESFEYFCQISSQTIFIIVSYTVSMLGQFFETQSILNILTERLVIND